MVGYFIEISNIITHNNVQEAREKGVIPAEDTKDIGGSWSALSEAGEATNLNLVHLTNIDCTDVEDLTKVTALQ